ncbi:MAG: hypothetical protein RM347_016820 [Nostoc sp. ChiQUE02]|uniref:hypothetical protein n=1 Tax=Nostoc sp. ChiQUE02 TaxID=3075377 RepID=UPI002AD4C134|nr:hypothetical protein [Nostoc sp. ChiQUE02]MDZ8229044.1 hypothetical protein [Nostoc sp. ChiQUE02]
MWQTLIIDQSHINQKIDIFKAALGDYSLTEKLIVQKYIIHGTPYIFKDDEGKYFDLQHEIATHFEERPECVLMVGSSKLGFSIAPSKLWNSFSEESDIDIAIISRGIFEKFWSELYDFDISLVSRSEREEQRYKKFLKYFFKGWLRPDLFPFKYYRTNEWFEYFKSISYKYTPQKIAGGIYYNSDLFEKYHMQNIKNLRQENV